MKKLIKKRKSFSKINAYVQAYGGEICLGGHCGFNL